VGADRSNMFRFTLALQCCDAFAAFRSHTILPPFLAVPDLSILTRCAVRFGRPFLGHVELWIDEVGPLTCNAIARV
jgi:hypothetical protein